MGNEWSKWSIWSIWSVGIDVAKATLAVALWDEEGHRALSWGTVANTAAGWNALATRLAATLPADLPAHAIRLTLEPTGGYELPLALWADQQGWQVVRPNPRHVRDWARGQGRRAKTDTVDAQVLAQYGAQPERTLWHPLPSEVAALEQLLHRRDEGDEGEEVADLLQRERIRAEHVAVHPQMPPAVPASVKRLVKALEEELAEVEQAIAEHLAAHDAFQQAKVRLLSVPGIGQKNVLPLLSLLLRWQATTAGAGTSKGLVALVGLDPRPYESGTSVHRHATISHQGERLLRARLYMGALGAAVHGHSPLQQFYDRLVARGKAKRLALVAAARKILIWAWAVFTSGQPFDATKVAVHHVQRA